MYLPMLHSIVKRKIIFGVSEYCDFLDKFGGLFLLLNDFFGLAREFAWGVSLWRTVRGACLLFGHLCLKL